MSNFLLKALYGALGTLLVSVGQFLTGQSSSTPVEMATMAGLIGAATGAVATGKRVLKVGKK